MTEIDITPEAVLLRKIADAITARKYQDAGWSTVDQAAAESPYIAGEIMADAKVVLEAVQGQTNATPRALAEAYRAQRIALHSILAGDGTTEDYEKALRNLIIAGDQLVVAVLR